MQNLMITGGAGFIGSNFVRLMLDQHPDYRLTVYDKLTYAGNLDNLRDVADHPHYRFVHGDIGDAALVEDTIRKAGIDTIVNFAAETHVDRSIQEPGSFIMTDVYGTYVLLEATRKLGLERLLHVSTDEVYGDIPSGSSTEGDNYAPRSPYSASKAGGELMCHAYFATFQTPVVITRGSNNYGPWQYPEKLIPLFITNLLDGKSVPVYGDGQQVRDWIYVLDHCTGIDTALHHGTLGEAYNVGGGNEKPNLEITQLLLDLTERGPDLITYVADRPGHDRRYSLDTSKLRGLGWAPAYPFAQGLHDTVAWYRDNRWWWEKIKSGEYSAYYQKQYGNRAVPAK
ncbi:MAG: dTDP-glucose 4,6-dehydratase [Chloroflexota bacterium]|nr:dTDP-glucose 4,6-dehydratase [Chloroflexota bacterium]